MSSARRFACTRLCVVMTMVVPRAWMSTMICSTERAAAGSRLAVGSSRNSTSGRSAHTRANASFCCSPPESTRAGRADSARKPTSSSASVDASIGFVAANASQVQRVADVFIGGPAQHHRPLEHHRLAARLASVASPHAMEPALGGMRPCSTRSSVLLPAPLGPSRTVRPPATSMRSMPAEHGHAARRRGDLHQAGSADRWRAQPKRAFAHPRVICADRVQQHHDRDQHQSQRQRQRQVALAGLERDRRRHHPRDAVDVAADDHHRADFRDRAAESRQQHGGQRKARVPQQRHRRAEGACAQRRQLFAVFRPRVGHDLARERGDDGRDQDRLRDRPSRRA